jgi:hypothetical protein
VDDVSTGAVVEVVAALVVEVVGAVVPSMVVSDDRGIMRVAEVASVP